MTLRRRVICLLHIEIQVGKANCIAGGHLHIEPQSIFGLTDAVRRSPLMAFRGGETRGLLPE